MSTKTKSLVFGYVHSNYLQYVPEVIVKRLLLFYNPVTTFKFKGKEFKSFIESPVGTVFKKKIKFNQYLSVIVEFIPNQTSSIKPKGFVSLRIIPIITKPFDYFCINAQILCEETQTLVPIFYKITQEMYNKIKSSLAVGHAVALSRIECKQQKELTFRFTINSLSLRRKKDENKEKMLFYPSLNDTLLHKESLLSWNIDTHRFDKCIHRQVFYSASKGNFRMICGPKGMSVTNDRSMIALALFVWPYNVSSMVLGVVWKIDDDITDEDEQTEIVKTEADWSSGCLKGYYLNGVEWDKINKFKINVKVIIKRIYDLNNNEIAINEWMNHNVVAN